MKRGPSARDRDRMPTAAEEAELARRMRSGDASARSELIRRNMPVVVSSARRYRGRGLDFEDLVQWGCVGLIEGVDRFDPGRDCRLMTYAKWWVRQSIVRALANDGSLIRVPVHVLEARSMIARGQPPYLGTMSARSMAAHVAAADLARKARCRGIPSCPEIDPIAQIPGREESGSESEGDPEAVLALIPRLRERHALALRLHFGLDGESPRTMEEVGRSLGVSKARAGQLVRDSIEKIREMESAKFA